MLLEKRSLPFLPVLYLSSPLLSVSWFLPGFSRRSRALSLLFACVSLSRSLGVTTAAPRCVRKLECHVLTGVRGMLTGQTEGTDGSVTCPRSSGMPLSGALDFEIQLFLPTSFSFLRISPLTLPPSFLPSLILSFHLSLSRLYHLLLSLLFIPFPSLLCLPCLILLFSVYHPFPPQCRSQSLLPISA